MVVTIAKALLNNLSFNVNEQMMIMVQMTHKVKEKACPYLQRRLLNVTGPDKWSQNTSIWIPVFICPVFRTQLYKKIFQNEDFLPLDLVRCGGKIAGYLNDDIGIITTRDTFSGKSRTNRKQAGIQMGFNATSVDLYYYCKQYSHCSHQQDCSVHTLQT